MPSHCVQRGPWNDFQIAMISARQSCAELTSHYLSDTLNEILVHSSCNMVTLLKISLCNFIIKWHKLACSVCMHTHIHKHTHRDKCMYIHTYTHFHVRTLVKPFHIITVQKRYGSDVKQALPHTVTVCHHEHGLQWWRVCRNDNLAVKFCMFNTIKLPDSSEYLSVNFSVITGDFKVFVYCNCCWSSHATSWLS